MTQIEYLGNLSVANSHILAWWKQSQLEKLDIQLDTILNTLLWDMMFAYLDSSWKMVYMSKLNVKWFWDGFNENEWLLQ